MKKLFSILFLSTLTLSGCVTTATDTTNETGYIDYCSQYDDKQVALVTDTGGVNDKSFNQGTWEGIQGFCQENEVGADVIESTSSDQFEVNLNSAAENHEVVVASGFLFETAIFNSASAHPDTEFIFIDGMPADASDKDENGLPKYKELNNVQSFLFKEQEAGYLAGYIAASKSETKKIGFIGGQEIPPVQKFGWGYLQGAYAADPTVEVSYQYSNTFEDASIAKSIADTMYSKDFDIIFTAAGAANDGIIQSSIENNKQGNSSWVIGVDTDMYEYGYYTDEQGNEKNVILTSALKEVGNAAKLGLDSWKSETFESATKTLGYNEGGVGVPNVNKNLETEEAIIEDAKKSLSENPPVSTKEDTKNVVEGMVINGEI